MSILIPARNEERNLEEALRSVLALDYDNLEIDVVDDRSTDRTGEILDRMAAAEPRLRVVRVRELPPGWLGKNHALWLGAEKATGEFLLFTDADVVLEPSALRRAVGASWRRRGARPPHGRPPSIARPSVLFEMFIGAFSLFFALFTRPWKAKDPKSPHYVGIGAFNLVRATAYRAVGGHRTIAMRPDDDLKLGKILKTERLPPGVRLRPGRAAGRVVRLGPRADPGADEERLLGGGLPRPGGGRGDGGPARASSSGPSWRSSLIPGPARWLNLASVLVLVALCWINAPLAGVRRWHGVGFPLATLLFLYILWRATLLTLWNDGIDWRGTHYPLAELKANKV